MRKTRAAWMAGWMIAALIAHGSLPLLIAQPQPSATQPATQPTPKMDGVSPVLRSDSVANLVKFYRDNLGFKVNFGGEPQAGYASVERDDVSFHITRTDGEFGPVAVYVYAKNVDALYAEFTARGVKMDRKPENQPYGMRDFSLTDPDGNRVTFGQSSEKHPAP